MARRIPKTDAGREEARDVVGALRILMREIDDLPVDGGDEQTFAAEARFELQVAINKLSRYAELRQGEQQRSER